MDFTHPAVLLLLPLALLPLRPRASDSLSFPWLAWLPADPRERLWRTLLQGCAVLAILATVLGLAGPGRNGAVIERTGRGAEALILLDRSSSMDEVIVPKNKSVAVMSGQSKNQSARELLEKFVTRRPTDRFALMTFSARVMPVATFAERPDAVLAGLAAAGIGRGLPSTDMAAALLAAIKEFSGRPYAGSRIVLLVSDGGAQLDTATRQRIQDGMVQQRIGLYFIYLRGRSNSPDLLHGAAGQEDSAEMALHRFFGSLPTPYHLYQADDAQAMAAALADIDRQQNLPLRYTERTPRRDDSRTCYLLGLLAGLLLWGGRALQLRSWS